MANLIEIIIQAQDAASSIIEGVGSSLKGVGGQMTQLGTSLTLITAPIDALLGASLKAASDADTAFAQLNQVIKSTGGVAGITADAAEDLATSLSKVTRYDDEVILGGENLLFTFTNIGKTVFPQATQAILDVSTAMGQDLKSSAVQVGKALNDPTAGLTALTRIGVTFNEQQKEQIKTMQAAGDMAGAQSIILKELQREFGGSAEAAGKTFAGQIDILRTKMGNLSETIGHLLMPILQNLTNFISPLIDKIQKWADENPALAQTIVIIAAAVGALGPILIILGTIISSVGTITAAFGGILEGIALGPIALVVAAVAALFWAFQNNFLGIRDIVQPIIDTVVKGIGEFIFQIQASVNAINDGFGHGGVVDALTRFFGIFEDGSSAISGILQKFGVLPETADSIAGAIGAAFSKIRPVITAVQDAVEYFVKGFSVNLTDLVFHAEYIFQQVSSTITTTLGNIWTLVKPLLQPIIDWLTGAGTDSLSGAIKTIAGLVDFWIISPIEGIWAAVQPTLASIVNWFTGSDANSFVGAVTTAWNFINDHFFVPLINSWNDWIKPAFQPLINFFVGLWDNVLKPALQPILDFFVGLYNTIADAIERVNRLNPSYAPQRTLQGEVSPGVNSTSSQYRGASNIPASEMIHNILGDVLGSGFASLGYQAHALGSDLGSLIGLGLGQFSNLGTGTAFQNAGTAFHDFPGTYQAGEPLLVGTGAQPEMFVPQTSGYAVPNAGESGGGRFVWNGDLNVPPNSSINVTRDEFWDWMDEWAEETGLYG